MSLDLPTEAEARMETEAVRRGMSVESLISEIAERFPVEDPLDAFIGSGSSELISPRCLARAVRRFWRRFLGMGDMVAGEAG
jgi:hypothetical protein